MTIDQAILDLIQRETLMDQAGLRERLTALGFDVTQPTLSRHLKRLNVEKVAGVYRRVEREVAGVPDYTLTLVPPNLIVLKTQPGHAQVFGLRLDGSDIEGVMGTLAGDDTVFIAVSGQDLQTVLARIEALLEQ